MSDMGVINIINNRTGKKYTAGSTNIDQLMNQYKNKIEHAHHHNEELRKDAEKGDTFRFEVVSRNCKTEDEIRALRDSEIYRNRNNTYNSRHCLGSHGSELVYRRCERSCPTSEGQRTRDRTDCCGARNEFAGVHGELSERASRQRGHERGQHHRQQCLQHPRYYRRFGIDETACRRAVDARS